MTPRERLRKELVDIVDLLLEESRGSGEISLDAIGEAIGARAVSQEDIDVMLEIFEESGRRVITPRGGMGEQHLHRVLTTARALLEKLGRRPTMAEIAETSGLEIEEVRHALTLARIMQR